MIPSTAHLSIRQSFYAAWQTCRREWRVLFPFVAALLLMNALVDKGMRVHHTHLMSLLSALWNILELVIIVGVIHVSVRAARGQHIVWEDFWKPAYFLKFITTTIVFSLPLVALFFILVFSFFDQLLFLSQLAVGTDAPSFATVFSILGPWFFVAGAFVIFLAILYSTRYYFYQFAAVDQELWPYPALNEASRLTEGNRLFIFCLWIVLGVLNVLGAATVVGLVLTLPLTFLVLGIVYERLRSHAHGQSNEFPIVQPPEIEASSS